MPGSEASPGDKGREWIGWVRLFHLYCKQDNVRSNWSLEATRDYLRNEGALGESSAVRRQRAIQFLRCLEMTFHSSEIETDEGRNVKDVVGMIGATTSARVSSDPERLGEKQGCRRPLSAKQDRSRILLWR